MHSSTSSQKYLQTLKYLQSHTRQLNHKPNHQLRMFQHMRKIHSANGITRSMNIRILIIHLALKHHGTGIPTPRRTRMIRARIPTPIIRRRHTRIRRNHPPHERRQRSIHIVGNDAEFWCEARGFVALGVAGHVLVQHGGDIAAGGFVVLEDGLGTEEAAFFAGVPVEFDGLGELA